MTTNTKKTQEALRMALEALEFYPVTVNHWKAVLLPAAQAIREALAENPAQEQEPVAWMYQCSADSSGPVFMQHKRDWAESGSGLWTEKPLYTSPQPSKPWVGLTDEQIEEIAARTLFPVNFARAIEARLKELNT